MEEEKKEDEVPEMKVGDVYLIDGILELCVDWIDKPGDLDRVYSYIFVWNNWKEGVQIKLHDNVGEGLDMAGCAWTEQVGAQGTPHLQGFAQSHKALTSATMQKRYGGFWQSMHGTVRQSCRYVVLDKKDGATWANPCVLGVFIEKEQGKRSDILAVRDAILNGASMREVAQEHFSTYLHNERALSKYRKLVEKPPEPCVKGIHVFLGPPGCGKTHWVFNNEPDLYRLQPSENTSWWDDYEGQEAVLIDDFMGDTPIRMIMAWTDKWPVKVRTGQGGQSEWLRAKRIYITTNIEPMDWYPNARQITKLAMMRRIVEIRRFSPPVGEGSSAEGAIEVLE